MKNNKNNIIITMQVRIVTSILILFASSCTNKEWDEHYSTPSYTDENLFDALSKNPNYKTFVDLIVKTKCDTIIKRGNQYTVFALTNDALSALNTDMSIENLTAIMQMHITPSAIYPNRMNNMNTPAVSGKLLKFKTTANGFTVNNVSIIEPNGVKTLNGIIYQIEKPINSLPNLYDIIASDPDLTLYRKFIDDNMYMIPDPDNNIVIGYDTLNLPIYEKPVNYIYYSEFLQTAKPDDEQTVSTAFFPSNDFVGKALDRMLAVRAGRIDLIAPRLWGFNQDTLVAGRYFRTEGNPFPGDTAILLNKIFMHTFVRGEIPSLSGIGTFTNIAKDRLTISSAQVKRGALEASNGYYYILDDVDVPELFFRNEFWLTPQIKTGVVTYADNPGITYFDMTVRGSVTSTLYCHTRRYTEYNCRTAGSGINFKWPFVTAGAYKVMLSYFSSDFSGVFDVTCGAQLLEKGLVTGSYYNLRMLLNVVKELGTVNVDADGEVEIVFTCANTHNNPRGQEDSFRLYVDYLMLQPIDD